LNHCCEPSLGAWNNDCEAYDFIALRNIQKGEELTFDYDTTEFKARLATFRQSFDSNL
jgi:SET domain-containing protein